MPAPEAAAHDLLRNLDLFRGLAEPVIRRLASASAVLRAPAGTMLFSRGAPCTGVHVIAYGLVKLSVTSSNGGEKVIDILGHGASLGESFIFSERPHAASAEALEDSLIVFIGKSAIVNEVAADSAFARNMLTRLAERVQRYASELEATALTSAAARLISFLIGQLAERPAASGAQELDLPICKSVLASRLSVTREHLSRLLRQLSDERLIEVRGRHVSIRDVAQLREFAVLDD